MKKILLSLFLSLMLVLTACGGNVRNVKKTVGESQQFTAQEIEDAMDTAIHYFAKEFNGCTMTEIIYSESASHDAAAEWAVQYGADEGIVLLSTFEVDETGGDGSLNPGSTYRNWQWILVRTDGGDWELKTWGYG